MKKVLFFLLVSAAAWAGNPYLDLNLKVPGEILQVDRAGNVTVNSKDMENKGDSGEVFIGKGSELDLIAEVKRNPNKTLNSIVTIRLLEGAYQVLDFDNNGKIASRANCKQNGDITACDYLTPKFCYKIMDASRSNSLKELHEKMKSCRKLSEVFETEKQLAKTPEERDKALKETKAALNNPKLWKAANREASPVAEDKFDLRYTGSVEAGIFEMMETTEDCVRFAEQGLLPPKQANARAGGAIQ